MRNLWLLLAMVLCAGAAIAITPKHKIADRNPMPNLSTLIPQQIGQWRQIPGSNQIIDPGQAQKLNSIYDQVYTKTFENTRGYRVMLSLAYGGNQRDELELHKPEVCYVAQGFTLYNKESAKVNILNRQIPVVRLQTKMNARYEPVTYWAVVGDTVVHSSYHKKITELKYGLKGEIPDGLLVRASSIDTDNSQAFIEQEDFLKSFVESLPPESQSKLLGKF